MSKKTFDIVGEDHRDLGAKIYFNNLEGVPATEGTVKTMTNASRATHTQGLEQSVKDDYTNMTLANAWLCRYMKATQSLIELEPYARTGNLTPLGTIHAALQAKNTQVERSKCGDTIKYILELIKYSKAQEIPIAKVDNLIAILTQSVDERIWETYTQAALLDYIVKLVAALKRRGIDPVQDANLCGLRDKAMTRALETAVDTHALTKVKLSVGLHHVKGIAMQLKGLYPDSTVTAHWCMSTEDGKDATTTDYVTDAVETLNKKNINSVKIDTDEHILTHDQANDQQRIALADKNINIRRSYDNVTYTKIPLVTKHGLYMHLFKRLCTKGGAGMGYGVPIKDNVKIEKQNPQERGKLKVI